MGQITSRFRNLRKFIETNPYFILLGTSISVGIVVFSVSSYFFSQKIDLQRQRHELEMSQLQTRLTSINRKLGDKEFLDIKSFIHSGATSPTVSNTSKLFSEDNFYATADDSFWIYSKSAEAELANMTYPGALEKLNPDTDKEMIVAMRLMKDVPMHLWVGKPDILLIDEAEHGTVRLFPYIYVERISYETDKKLRQLAAKTFDSQQALQDGESKDEYQGYALDNLYRGDYAGYLLMMVLNQIYFMMPVNNPNHQIQLISSQKVGNVLYAQFLEIHKNVKLVSNDSSHLYLRREHIIVTTPNEVYIISTSVPSTDPSPRGDSFNQVTKWFDDLAIIVN